VGFLVGFVVGFPLDGVGNLLGLAVGLTQCMFTQKDQGPSTEGRMNQCMGDCISNIIHSQLHTTLIWGGNRINLQDERRRSLLLRQITTTE
jgi:hypothetical protein